MDIKIDADYGEFNCCNCDDRACTMIKLGETTSQKITLYLCWSCFCDICATIYNQIKL